MMISYKFQTEIPQPKALIDKGLNHILAYPFKILLQAIHFDVNLLLEQICSLLAKLLVLADFAMGPNTGDPYFTCTKKFLGSESKP